MDKMEYTIKMWLAHDKTRTHKSERVFCVKYPEFNPTESKILPFTTEKDMFRHFRKRPCSNYVGLQLIRVVEFEGKRYAIVTDGRQTLFNKKQVDNFENIVEETRKEVYHNAFDKYFEENDIVVSDDFWYSDYENINFIKATWEQKNYVIKKRYTLASKNDFIHWQISKLYGLYIYIFECTDIDIRNGINLKYLKCSNCDIKFGDCEFTSADVYLALNGTAEAHSIITSAVKDYEDGFTGAEKTISGELKDFLNCADSLIFNGKEHKIFSEVYRRKSEKLLILIDTENINFNKVMVRCIKLRKHRYSDSMYTTENKKSCISASDIRNSVLYCFNKKINYLVDYYKHGEPVAELKVL